jgi:hypothetical protein
MKLQLFDFGTLKYNYILITSPKDLERAFFGSLSIMSTWNHRGVMCSRSSYSDKISRQQNTLQTLENKHDKERPYDNSSR